MIRRARRLAERCHCCVADITRRVARHLGRSPLTVLHTIRKHDHENPGDAIFARASEPISDADRVVVLKAHRRGVSIKAIAGRGVPHRVDHLEGTIDYWAGCGIVADSRPDEEWRESETKSRVLRLAIGDTDR